MQPIVLIHGHSLDTRMWQPQQAAFSQYQIITPLLQGYGHSSQATDSYADDVIAQLEPVPKFHLVGLSLGGNIALEIAVRYPQRVASLALLDSSLKGFAPDAAHLAVGTNVAVAFAESGLNSARAEWLDAPLFAPARENPVLKAQLTAWVQDYSGWHWAQGISPSAPILDVSQRLAEVTAPTLIVVGQRDTVYFQNVARYLLGIPNSTLEVVAHAGHMVNLEQVETVNRLLLDHWDKNN